MRTPQNGSNNYNSFHLAFTEIISDITQIISFLANVNSRSRSLYVIARPSVCRL